MATRLYFIVARAGPTAVVFRRGPTQQVELCSWNLHTDTVTRGQWLKGRIYERRSDLSPSGSLLVYFAATYGRGLRTWTAISRPPYLTALALWPHGDGWGGGALFDSELSVRLNHKAHRRELAAGFRLRKHMRVTPIGDWAGYGEDDPIHHERLVRDGWTAAEHEGKTQEHGLGASRWLTFDPPVVYRRSIGERRAEATLEMSIEGIHERQGSWYVTSWRIARGTDTLLDLGRADWADRGPGGDLLLARDGRLLRVAAPQVSEGWADAPAREIADLRADTFERMEAPASALRWR